MKNLKLLLLFLVCTTAFAHTINYENQILRHWTIPKEHRFIDGSFSMLKDGKVYIENAQNDLERFPIASLSKADQDYVYQKVAQIKALNSNSVAKATPEINKKYLGKMLLMVLFLIAFAYFLIKATGQRKRKYLIPIVVVGASTLLFSFGKKMLTTTDPTFVNSAFTPFVPNVYTSWDNTYFYVESKGVPNHQMMVGISNHGWQQQVPIPQCYIGANHWSIPLNPVVAATPVPVSANHFLVGAIAIAANGVAIFNYHTNTGVDSFLDGQLDIYGGHCGRGDDYHYHTAPLHLYTLGQTTTNLPCAFALDGYAVYGSVEPDGSPMISLDANHGHYVNGVYHYHGTTTAPYMIGNMVGQVTEDSNLQIIPQAHSNPVRTENWGPLSGALITSCVTNAANNGYSLSYSLNGTPGYATNFSWSGTTYTFKYVTPSTTTTTNYNGFTQCTVPLATTFFDATLDVQLFPNPASETLFININNPFLENEVRNISVYDAKGSLVYKTAKFTSNIDIKTFEKGNYLVKIQFLNSTVTKKVIIK